MSSFSRRRNNKNHEAYECRLPGQTGQENPHELPSQTKIFIVGFRKHTDYPSTFPTTRLQSHLQAFTDENKFFNPRAKSRNREDHYNSVEVHSHRGLVKHGAQCTFLIRPRIRPNANFHTVQQIFNDRIRYFGIMTLWVPQRELDLFNNAPARMELLVKIMCYEDNWMRIRKNKNLPKFDQISDYIFRMLLGVKVFWVIERINR